MESGEDEIPESAKRRAWWRPRLPEGLLVLYALNALADSFPLTATTEWLNSYLKMSQATQSMFYAATFVPYSFKPVYAALSEIAGRRMLFVGATALEAAFYVLCGTLVESTAGAFGAVLFREICSACAEMMLSATLADCVSEGRAAATRAQAEAAGARWCGTVAGYGVSLWMYSCGNKTAPARLVISCTAAILGPAALVGCLLPPRIKKETTSGGAGGAPLLILSQISCAWVALKDVLVVHHRAMWRGTMYALGAVVGGAALATAVFFARSPPVADEPLLPRPSSKLKNVAFSRRALAPGALALALNAAPSASVQISNLEYYLFFSAKPCYVPYVELVVAASSLAACGAYAAAALGGRVRFELAVFVAVAAAVSLLFGPLSRAHPLGHSDSVCLRGSCLGRFAYDATARVFTAFFSELALLAQTTLVLRSALVLADGTPHATIYGAFLALVDAGASVSGWVTAPLVQRANITYANFHHLPWLLRVCALASILALTPTPFVQA